MQNEFISMLHDVLMCSNFQISIRSRFYFESLVEELFYGQQYSEAVEMVDKVDFK